MTFLKDTEIAEMIGISVNTLRTWRRRATGPKFIKAEAKKGAVRYEMGDVLSWIENARIRGGQ